MTEVEAQANLDRAICDYLHATGADADNAIPTDWVLVVASTPLDTPGITVYTNALRDGDMPVHRQLGLLEYAVCRVKHSITTPD